MKYFVRLLFIFMPAVAAAQDTLTIQDIPAAERVLGLQFTSAERDSLFNNVKENRHEYEIG